jgi:hypothetical protein
MFGVTVHPQTLKETDSLRGDVPRSRWVERALIMYNASMMKEGEGENNNNDNNSGVRGSKVTSQAVPTSTTNSSVTETNTLITKEVSVR